VMPKEGSSCEPYNCGLRLKTDALATIPKFYLTIITPRLVDQQLLHRNISK
ncbi:unnamed protein product, partial [Ceratitis capitata]